MRWQVLWLTLQLSVVPAAAARAQVTANAATAAPQLKIVGTLPPGGGARAVLEARRTAYLLVYFKDDDHSLHFAVSRDGYSFTDVNSGRAVLSGRLIAQQQGIRDPHIIRGPDGAFYMTMTDLHIFGKREGLRATEWERPHKAYSWGNNRNMIFMRSRDLLNWTLSTVTISDLFPAYADAGCTWAPQTIWDPTTRRMMVYFTTRHGNGPNIMVASYADASFRTLTTEPRQMLYYGNPRINTIDADVSRIDGKYRMFYVAHDKPGGIRQAVSDRIDRGYVFDPRKVDPEAALAEAPNLWRRQGTDRYVLMYDVFGVKPHNMGFAETTDFVTFRNLGRFNDPGSPMKATNFSSPKHATVMSISVQEAERLERHFGNGR